MPQQARLVQLVLPELMGRQAHLEQTVRQELQARLVPLDPPAPLEQTLRFLVLVARLGLRGRQARIRQWPARQGQQALKVRQGLPA